MIAKGEIIAHIQLLPILSPVEETAPQEKNLKAAKRKINKRKLSSSSDDIVIAMF